MAALKRGGAAAHERAVVVRDGRGTAGKNTYTHTHTPVSVIHAHTAKKKKKEEERNGREGACGEEQGLLQTFVCFLETLEREEIKWSGRGSEAREARPPAATGKAVRARERGNMLRPLH